MMAVDGEQFHRRTTTFDELNELSKKRPLTPLEERRMQRALRQKYGNKGQKPWTHFDEQRLISYLMRGTRPATIASIMGRTERAIWTKMWRIGLNVGKAVRQELSCPIGDEECE